MIRASPLSVLPPSDLTLLVQRHDWALQLPHAAALVCDSASTLR